MPYPSELPMTAHARCFHALSILAQLTTLICCVVLLSEVIHLKKSQNTLKNKVEALQDLSIPNYDEDRNDYQVQHFI